MVGPGATDPFANVQGKVSMFIAGFIMLTPHRIAMTCAPHILKRYHLPPDVVGLFIYKIHTPMELSNVLGQYIANIIAWIVRATKTYRAIYRGFSIISVWLMFISGIMSYKLFKSGDDYGYFDKFFWSVIFMTFTNGLYCASTFKLEGHFASMYGAGVPSSGFFTFFLHKICEWLSRRFDWEDFDHSILNVQFWVTILTLGLSAIWWTADIGMDIKNTAESGWNRGYGTQQGNDKEPDNKGILKLFTGYSSEKDNPNLVSHAYDWSPILMLAASLGTVYAFYPSISPYQLVEDDIMGKRIDLWILFTAAIPNFAVAVLDIIEEVHGKSKDKDLGIGPSGRSWTQGKSWPWQLSWIAIIPYLLCIYIFLSFMHYPEGFFGRHMRNKNWLVYIVCITFNFFQEWLESIGFAGAGAQIQHTATKTNRATVQVNAGDTDEADKRAFNKMVTYTNPQPYYGTYNSDVYTSNKNKPFLQDGDKSGRINFVAGTFNDDIASFNVNERMILFVATKHHVEFFRLLLNKFGYKVSFVYGTMDMNNRTIQMSSFKRFKSNILIVTDLAARGLDLPMIDVVINFDFPHSPKLFIHRIGRTARAGKQGLAISILTYYDFSYCTEIIQHVGRNIILYNNNTTKSIHPPTGITLNEGYTASIPIASTVGLADSSSNYLSLKSKATPGDRVEGSDGSSIMGMMEDGAKDVLDVTSSGIPGSDLWELEGEINRRGTTPSGKTSGIEVDRTSVVNGTQDMTSSIEVDSVNNKLENNEHWNIKYASTDFCILGTVGDLLFYNEKLMNMLNNDSELESLKRSMDNSYNLYYKTRPNPSNHSIDQSKLLIESLGGINTIANTLHPTYNQQLNNSQSKPLMEINSISVPLASTVGLADSSPLEVQSNSHSLADSSSNSLPVNGIATPGDGGGGGSDESRMKSSTGPQVEPGSDLRELEGELNRRAPCNGIDGPQVDAVCKTTLSESSDIGITSTRQDILDYLHSYRPVSKTLNNIPQESVSIMEKKKIFAQHYLKNKKNNNINNIDDRSYLVPKATGVAKDVLELPEITLNITPDTEELMQKQRFKRKRQWNPLKKKYEEVTIDTITNRVHKNEAGVKVKNTIENQDQFKKWLKKSKHTLQKLGETEHTRGHTIDPLADDTTLSSTRGAADNSPHEVSPAVSSSNYISLKGKATPGDRGGGGSDWTSSGIPGSDLRELEGELNRRAVCKTTSVVTTISRDGSSIDSDNEVYEVKKGKINYNELKQMYPKHIGTIEAAELGHKLTHKQKRTMKRLTSITNNVDMKVSKKTTTSVKKKKKIKKRMDPLEFKKKQMKKISSKGAPSRSKLIIKRRRN